jgi:hypothetical protein
VDNVRVLLIARLLYGDDQERAPANDRQLRSACTESKLCPEQLFKCAFISERFKWLLKQVRRGFEYLIIDTVVKNCKESSSIVGCTIVELTDLVICMFM